MQISQFDVWMADLSPQVGTEPGKKRPVLIIQTNMLNHVSHPSSIICPLTSNVEFNATILRVHLQSGEGNLIEASDILIDQIRAIDNRRLIKKIGTIPIHIRALVKENIQIVLDLHSY